LDVIKIWKSWGFFVENARARIPLGKNIIVLL
jgi:hypothetical protein